MVACELRYGLQAIVPNVVPLPFVTVAVEALPPNVMLHSVPLLPITEIVEVLELPLTSARSNSNE